MIKYCKQLFYNTWTHSEQLATENSKNKNHFVNVSGLFILVYIAVGLSVLKYFGNASAFIPNNIEGEPGAFRIWFNAIFLSAAEAEFYRKIFWVSAIVLIYLVIPLLIVKFVFKQKPADYGFNLNKNVLKDYPVYLLMLAIMLPIVFYASSTASFQARYPIFHPKKENLYPLFIYWQVAYFVQFIAVEFFFRGFILHGLKHKFGYYAVFISMVPYCMVHFGKPFPETLAAIIAGIVLGTLSLKSRSIFMGVIIHYSVAITMDIFALYREGLLS